MQAERWTRTDWILLALVTSLAAALRLFQLGTIPIGFHFDEAYNGIDTFLVMHGGRPLFLPANLGREPLYTYWQALVASIGGLSPYTLRLSSAILGIVSIPATYILLRRILQQHSRVVAAITSTTLAVSLWHIHFSHYGIRVIMMPLLFTGVFGFFWLGVHAQRRSIRLLSYAISGLLAGCSVWTHPTGRLIPIVLILYVAWLIWSKTATRGNRTALDRLTSPLGGLVITGTVAFLIFLPLGLEFYRHPAYFFGHVSTVSIFNEQVGGGRPFYALLENLGMVLGMFSQQGDWGWTHNLAGRPVFDPLLALFFYVGVIWWAVRLWRPNDPDRSALMLLGLWTVTMLWASILSDDAPDFSRTLPTLPALFVAVGLGLGQVFSRVKPLPGIIAVVLVLTISGGIAARDYFVRFPQRAPEYYRIYATHLRDSIEYLEQYADDHQLYLSQLWGNHPTARFYRWLYGMRSIEMHTIDTSDTVVLPPPGQGIVYGFPPEQHERAEQLAALWTKGTVEEIVDRFGKPLLSVVRIDAESVTDFSNTDDAFLPLDADLVGTNPLPQQIIKEEAGLVADGREPSVPTYLFGVSIHFVDAPVLETLRTDATGREVTIVWRVERPTERDLTTFLHVFNEDDERIGQVDKRPGNGSYSTEGWSAGERVIERYTIDYTEPPPVYSKLYLHIGWYELAADGLRRPRADETGDVVIVGPVVIRPVS